MIVDVIPNYAYQTDYPFDGKTAVVIDVLRCTSVIIKALDSGCKEVIPVLEPDNAFEIAERLGRSNVILGGERGCNKLPGFDCGNSPLEYTENVVYGKTVVITTSNGTRAINGSSKAATVLLGANSNSASIAEVILQLNSDVVIVCSGTNRKISADDLVSSGSIIHALLAADPGIETTDIAKVALALYESWKIGNFDITAALHCQNLIRLGYGEDIEYCMKENSSTVVPYYHDGTITRYNK